MKTNHKNSYEKEIKKLLLQMVSISPCKIPDNLSDYQAECLCECVRLDYVTGINYERTADGCPHFQEHKPFVTLKGREYIYRKNSNFRANLAIAISVFALLVPLLAYIKDIVKNIEWLLSLLA